MLNELCALVVTTHAASGSPRFQMLETIREFRLEHLLDAGELDDAELAYAQHFLAIAQVISGSATCIQTDRTDPEPGELLANPGDRPALALLICLRPAP